MKNLVKLVSITVLLSTSVLADGGTPSNRLREQITCKKSELFPESKTLSLGKIGKIVAMRSFDCIQSGSMADQCTVFEILTTCENRIYSSLTAKEVCMSNVMTEDDWFNGDLSKFNDLCNKYTDSNVKFID